MIKSLKFSQWFKLGFKPDNIDYRININQYGIEAIFRGMGGDIFAVNQTLMQWDNYHK